MGWEVTWTLGVSGGKVVREKRKGETAKKDFPSLSLSRLPSPPYKISSAPIPKEGLILRLGVDLFESGACLFLAAGRPIRSAAADRMKSDERLFWKSKARWEEMEESSVKSFFCGLFVSSSTEDLTTITSSTRATALPPVQRGSGREKQKGPGRDVIKPAIVQW